MTGPAAQYLDYIALPTEYPHADQLEHELAMELLAAADDVLERWKADDPLLRAMLDDRCTLWTWATVPAGTLPAGTAVRVGGWYGYIKPLRPDELNQREVSIEWTGRPDWPRYGPHVGITDDVLAQVPVPFDLSGLLDDDRPPVVTRKPSVGQWTAMNHAARHYNGRVYEPRGRGATRRLPALRRWGWVGRDGYLTAAGRAVVAAWTYDVDSGLLQRRGGGPG